MKEICVVHLVRAQNGIDPFKQFLYSYRANRGGAKHDLLIIFKGFDHPQDIEKYRVLLNPFQYLTLEISDEGFDITAYFAAVERYSDKYKYFCFLNSYSVIQDREWLRKLYENISRPGVGLVGATGTWNSHNANVRARYRGFGAAVFRRNNQGLSNIESWPHTKIPFWEAAFSKIRAVRRSFTYMIHFGSFPNFHIRTNVFMISGELMKSLECPVIQTKMDAYKFESGKKSLTMQILNKGSRVIVVGKDGVGYEKDEWHKSKTFWQCDQENLLITDNQSRDYQDGTAERRRFLSLVSWGMDYSEKQETEETD